MKDNCTYFGSYCTLNTSPIETDKLNDVILPKGEGFGEQHFMIKYESAKNQYYLKDLGKGTGTFIKI